MRKMDCWYPQSLIRALARVCLHVPYTTHREVGYLQDSKVSIPGGDLVFPRDGNPPVWGIPTIELNKTWFPRWKFQTDRWKRGRPPGGTSNPAGGCPALRLASLSWRREEGQSWQSFPRYLWQIALPTSRPHRGGILLSGQHLGLLALSQGQRLVYRAHSPQSKLLRGWLGRHSLESSGPWSGRQDKMAQTKGHLS